MPDRESDPIPLAFVSLRGRLLLGFASGMAAVLLVALLTVLAGNFSARQEARLRGYNQSLALVMGFARAALRLQMTASRFIYQGHDSALADAESLYQTWSGRASECMRRNCLGGITDGGFADLLAHLQAYHDAFTDVVESREALLDGLRGDFDLLRSYPGLDAAAGDDAGRGLGGELELARDHLAALESQLTTFAATFDPGRLEAARQHLEELRLHLRGSDIPGPGRDEATRRIAEVVNRRIQQMRGYSYLVNVVMASEAYEMLYLADRAAADVEVRIGELEADIDKRRRDFYLWLGIVIVAVAAVTLAIFTLVSRSIRLTLQQLAALFRRLAAGSEGTIGITSRHRDEIADLIHAARAFREENVRERVLLRELEQLNATLEEQVAERTQQLQDSNAELASLASTDNLTGISNRRVLDEKLEEELRRAQRYRRPLAVLMLDLDYFKQVNDLFGHLTGDEVLVAVADLLGNALRQSDTLGRWGGEEFMLICPETSLDSAGTLAEKLRQTIAEHSFPVPRRLTVSIGIAVSRADDTPEELVARADRALYAAKEQGRDRVRSEDPPLQASQS